jgi:2-aminoadipate transaminase
VFIDPGEPIIIERPTYVGAIQAFRAFDPDFRGVDMDFDGIIPEKLEAEVVRLIGEGRKPKFVYLIPDFQNPSGINLTLERRHEVLDIARRYDLIIIEDSPYRELRYEGKPIDSIYSMDTEGRVILLKTFSKTFCPGFRMGWIVAPPAVLEKLVMAKQGADLCTSAFVSILSAYLLMDGHLEKQVEIARELYAKKARVMLDALDEYMPDLEGLTWSKPDGGMFLWLRLPPYMDTVEMIKDAIELKVAYVIGRCFYTDGSGLNEMRLNFSYPSEEQIVEGIKRLAQVVEKRMPVTSQGPGYE